MIHFELNLNWVFCLIINIMLNRNLKNTNEYPILLDIKNSFTD